MTKPTLVLLHFFGGAGDTWRETVAELDGYGFSCFAPNLRGFGGNRADDVSFAANVSDVRAICESLGDAPVILAGHSMSGKIALAVAGISPPPNIVGLVLIAASPPTPEPMAESERNRLLNGANPSETLEMITANPLPAPLRERFLRDCARVSPEAWREWLEVGSKEDISASLAPVAVPALVIVGAEDDGMTAELMKTALLPHLPNAALIVTIADAAHLVPMEQPVRLAEAIALWWDESAMVLA